MNNIIKILIVIALIAAVGVVFALKHKDNVEVNVIVNNNLPPDSPPQVTENPQPAKSEPNVILMPEPAVTEPNVLENPQPAKAVVQLPHLVDLGAGKCIPCKMMKPILDELTNDYSEQFKVTFIDVWENPDQSKKYGVKMIPTQIFYDASGKELFRHVGFYSKEDILAKWKELGIDIQK